MTLTPKQEAFCLTYIETGNASAAYRRAYDASRMQAATIHRRAAELLDNSKITARLLELRQDAENKALITLEAHLDELAALRDEAKAKGQFSAAIRAEELRGRLCKLYEAPDEPEETRQPPSERRRTPEEEAHFRKILEPFARPALPLEAEPIAFKAIAIQDRRRVVEG